MSHEHSLFFYFFKMILKIKVKPNSRKNEVSVENAFSLKIKIKAVPEKGKANKELINFLSEIFEVPKSFIQIINGESSPNKRVKIIADEKMIQQKLNKLKEQQEL